MSWFLVQIQVDAYMLTLECMRFGYDEEDSEDLPVDAGVWESSAHATRGEPVLLEVLDVPRLDTGGAKKDAATLLQGAVESAGLGNRLLSRGVKPVHRVHYLTLDKQKPGEHISAGK